MAHGILKRLLTWVVYQIFATFNNQPDATSFISQNLNILPSYWTCMCHPLGSLVTFCQIVAKIGCMFMNVMSSQRRFVTSYSKKVNLVPKLQERVTCS